MTSCADLGMRPAKVGLSRRLSTDAETPTTGVWEGSESGVQGIEGVRQKEPPLKKAG